MQKINPGGLKKIIVPSLVFILAAIVYSQFGFYGKLLRDDAVFLYGGQRMAEGIPPYVGIFDVKGQIAPTVAGIGAVISKWAGSDDILTVRVVFLLASSMAAAAAYLLGESLFQSAGVGIFTAPEVSVGLFLKIAESLFVFLPGLGNPSTARVVFQEFAEPPEGDLIFFVLEIGAPEVVQVIGRSPVL